jgi:hypothetical protein
MALLEVFTRQGRTILDLDVAAREADEGFAAFIIGRSPEVWLTLDNPNVSRLHAKLSPVADSWTIEDLGSRNGTWVNGERLVRMRILGHGDEIRVASTTLLFRDPSHDTSSTTTPQASAPPITPREHDVLVELCRPFFGSNLVKAAAERKDIATALFTGEGAIQQHLGNLYRKFRIDDDVPKRRDALAVAVINSGIVGHGDYMGDGN